MLLAHKIALDPNAAQRMYFARASGTARFAYNWAFGEWQAPICGRREAQRHSAAAATERRQARGLPLDVRRRKAAVQEAIIDLGSAFRAFFEKRGKYPRFKRKDDSTSFCAANEVGTFRADGDRIKLPVIGWVRMREAVRFTGPLKRATISVRPAVGCVPHGRHQRRAACPAAW